MKMGFWQRLLDTLIDPNLISLMLSLGVLGLVVELWHPGLIFPATFGILCLAIAFFGLDVLPISWAGLLLIAAAFALLDRRAVRRLQPRRADAGGRRLLRLRLAAPVRAGRLRLPGLAVASSLAIAGIVLGVLRVRAREGRPDPAAAGRGRPADDRRRARAGRAATGSSRSGASSGRRATRTASRSTPGDEVEVVGVEGLALVVRPRQDPAPV